MLKSKFIRFILPFFIFLGLAFLALYRILLSPGLVGFTWDWDIPPFLGQIMTKMQSFFLPGMMPLH